MPNLPIPSDEQSKAIQKLSEFGVTAVNAGSELARYLGRILGAIPDDTAGLLLGDPLHAVRTIVAAKLDKLVHKILKERNVTETNPVSPSLAIPLVRAAYDESRPELQDIWARLIAAAMDANRASRVRLSFIETVKRFDPLDALVLQALAENFGELSPTSRDFLASRLAQPQDEIMLSANNLALCNCVKWRANVVDNPTFYISDYGRALIRACTA